ncbi:hypothetical protein LTR67_004993 [Exophiala xenobiotica]
MPRVPCTIVSVWRTARFVGSTRTPRPSSSAAAAVTRRHLSSTSFSLAKAPDSTPGWEGRSKEDNPVSRSPHDPQSANAQSGMKDHENLKEGSQAISRKDEGNNNKRAKEDHPEAPEPVIGMNEERGGVS